MALKAPTFSGLNARTIAVGTLESTDATSVKVDLGDDAGDDFAVDTNKLVVEGDTGRVGIGTATPASTLEMESSSGDIVLEMDNNASNSANFQIQNGAGNARVDLSMNDGSANTTITMKGQKVGIMDTSPSYTLDVTGDIRATGSLYLGSTAVTSSAAELNKVDGATAGTVVASKAVCVDVNKDITGFRNVTLTGELDAATLDISGDADIDGTLEADAITVGGTALAEVIADTVGAMVSGNTETNVAVTYEDGDNTLDFVVGTLNQDTSGTAAIATTVTVADESSDTSCNVLFTTAATGDLGPKSGTNLTFNSSNGTLACTALDISGDADIDGTLEADAITVDGTALNEFIADTVGAMVSSNTETGITVTYEDGDNTLDFALAQVTTNGIGDDQVTLAKMAGLARGKIIVGDSSGDPVALALGNDTQVLTSDGTDVIWANASGGSVSNDDANLILAVQSFS